jgi:hypothetical protein
LRTGAQRCGEATLQAIAMRAGKDLNVGVMWRHFRHSVDEQASWTRQAARFGLGYLKLEIGLNFGQRAARLFDSAKSRCDDGFSIMVKTSNKERSLAAKRLIDGLPTGASFAHEVVHGRGGVAMPPEVRERSFDDGLLGVGPSAGHAGGLAE